MSACCVVINMDGRWLRLPGGPSAGSSSSAHEANVPMEFETTVCYCFITRFPLFDFFFQVGGVSHLCVVCVRVYYMWVCKQLAVWVDE